jgi:hypothetical protein
MKSRLQMLKDEWYEVEGCKCATCPAPERCSRALAQEETPESIAILNETCDEGAKEIEDTNEYIIEGQSAANAAWGS